jgi:ABC-type antimicrobial peptide transport system permease subunit
MASLAMLVAAPFILLGTSLLVAEPEAQKKPAGTELDPRLAPVKDFVDLLLIQPSTGKGAPLTAQDAEALPIQCPSILAAAPVVRARDWVSYGKRKWRPDFIYGTSPDYLVVRDWGKPASGQPFTNKDVADQAAVCLLGQTVAHELFDKESALGKEVRFKNDRLKVVGVLKSKGSNAMGLDQDDIVLLPWTTLSARLAGEADGKGKPAAGVDMIMARKRAAKGVAEANREVTAVLGLRHLIAGGQADDFDIRDFSEFEKLLKKAKP